VFPILTHITVRLGLLFLAVIGEDLDLVDVVEGDRAASTGRS
jgi:hypothetical protein